MLQDIRKNVQGPFVKVIVWLIVIAFAAFGIESILLGGSSNSVAEVNGEEILPGELQQAINNQKRQLISMLGDNLDPAMLEDSRLQGPALEGLISRKLVLQSAEAMDLTVSEQELGRTIADMEQFQIDGAFNPDMYRNVLSQVGFTPASFKQTLREDLLNMQIRASLGGSEFITPQELGLNARLASEQRDVRYLTVPLEQFRQALQPSEAEIAAFYEENTANFLSPETVELDYLLLEPEDYREPVDEIALQDEYELEMSDYQYQTENRVSHILFEQGEEDDDAFEARIAAAREALASGTPFAEVARSFSDDLGSAAAGGDLGFSSGDAFPAAMEEAIDALEVEVVSDPVVTDAGTHILLVTERREAEQPTLDELRMELTDRIQLREARDAVVREAELLRDLAFNADSLEQPAAELELSVQNSGPITRSHSEGLFANAAVLEQAFSEDVLELGHNSEVVELSGNRFLVMSLRRYQEPAPKPLAEVRDEIITALSETAARDAVVNEAERALLALRGGDSVESFATENGYSWQVELGARRSNGNVPPEVLRRAFQLPVPEEGQTSFDYVESRGGDVLVFELVRVAPGSDDGLPGAVAGPLREQLTQESGSLVLSEYERGLRARAEISRL